MFNAKAKSIESSAAATGTTIIGAGTIIIGNIETAGDIRIDGILYGNLIAKSKVIIGIDGVVEGEVQAASADILGRVTGKMNIIDMLQLRGNCKVAGDIHAGKLEVESSARFNGNCQMITPVVEISNQLMVEAVL